MLDILLVTARRERLRSFAEGLSSDPEVRLDEAAMAEEAMNIVRTRCPHLVIVDSVSSGAGPLDLVRQILSANAMVNTAVVSPLSDEDFHDKSEGLGILSRLPPDPDASDSKALTQKLREVLGPANPDRSVPA